MTLPNLIAELGQLDATRRYGRVTGVLGMLLEAGGFPREAAVGDRAAVYAQRGRVMCEVVGFRAGRALLMPFGALDGIGLGCRVEACAGAGTIYPHPAWLGRVINAFGEPIDGKGPLPQGPDPYKLRDRPPPAHARKRVQGKIDLGVRALNTFLTCCRGQRMGIFSGSGVGKSVLMSMIARYTAADATVIGLVGERGREVQEFIEDDLGPEGLARSIVVVATSDESPLMRRQAAHLTLAVAEYLRDRELDVLCLIDSVTRFAMAQREIGLSAGEPPTTKGYTPTVFAELPKLLERAGPGTGKGSITGLFSVLVEGDDQNEPIADACRAILDGHIVLDRAIAERGRYPAINVLRSISRTMPQCNSAAENGVVAAARAHISTYEDMAELIRLGAYRGGSDARVDEAIRHYPALEKFLTQGKDERADLAAGYQALAAIVGAAA
ncbi:MAG TPA: flagellar protein export ATPase FliI [Stellaceae bacterium]|nr:flagellar protein export ATPase FliI [Stellaceae bacterium]